MLTQVNVKKFASYNWGLQDGLQQGIEQGIERGIERGEYIGKQSNAQQVAIKLLALGTFELSQIADISGLTLEEVEQLQRESE